MSELTLEEKTQAAARRAKLLSAEKHFFDKAQPHSPLVFSISYRNPGHWDIYAKQAAGEISALTFAEPNTRTSAVDGQVERAFRIRGEGRNVCVIDERWNPHKPLPRVLLEFKTVMAAMVWIADELMQEPVKDPTQ